MKLACAWASTRRQSPANEPRVLLALLGVRGCVMSADAGFTQPSTAAALTQAGADYVLALKGRQRQLPPAAQLAFAPAPTVAT
ncbi:transposase [Hymenobacter sp. RP-2-7]|uniref:Transposase n=1 Tax=Hymenobacter polaris TaxID=2682546 RepID=A0A7Y0AD90_9BACT|nr:hypothetical protein [Hymenobacter polaris]NML65197.1 transposase [Hymenobacter polaris]